MRSRQDRTCFSRAGDGTRVLRICWVDVTVIASDDVRAPALPGGVTTMIGVAAIPEPIVVDRALDSLGEPSSLPVSKSIAASPLSSRTA